jgi:hypothetical protein
MRRYRPVGQVGGGRFGVFLAGEGDAHGLIARVARQVGK